MKATLFTLVSLISFGTESVQDPAITTGLQTTHMIDADPPGFRVTWIRWDSGFRGSGLKIGDRIIAIDGQKITPPDNKDKLGGWIMTMIGQSGEARGWAVKGAKEGND